MFYQTFWDVVKDDLFFIFFDLYDGTANTGPIDYSYICPVPKKEGAKSVNEFRPISLINGVQKIISKVLANKIQGVLQEIISPSQSAFLKGRFILDSFVTASELVSWGTKFGLDSVGVKADFEKAYDRVNWDFLRKVMRWLGGNKKWCGWEEQCISNAKIAILVNGHPTKWIRTRRGLRQGDPLSPYLFLLVAEGLARLVERAISNNLLTSVGPQRDAKVAIIQYADDTIFFCEAKRRQMRNLLFLWQIFEWASGLKINKSKSELFYLGRIDGKGERLADILGCKLGTFPTRYLGLPLSIKSLRKEDWWSIIEKIEKRIEGWQAKLLSRGGRLVLVNSVLANLPLFFLSVFRAPSWAIRRIEALQSAFFWMGRSTITGGHYLVQWKSMCRSKKKGGLEILDLNNMNIALLAKWWWRFLSSSCH